MIAGFGIAGLATASAQYYGNMNTSAYSYGANYSYPYNTTNYTHSSNYNYGTFNCDSCNNSYGAYNGGVGSYTVGCTTYYYNTRTGTQLYTTNICNNYSSYNNYNYQNYQYPVNYTYPTSYTYPSQYYTYGYADGSWYPGYSSSIFTNTGYNYGYSNSNCYYQNGYQICY
jgi:hypothetical protein